MGKKLVDLESINGGAAAELFQEEWDKLMANIADVNTKPDMAREITIRVKVKPDKSRLAAETEVRVTSKLAGFPSEPRMSSDSPRPESLSWMKIPGMGQGSAWGQGASMRQPWERSSARSTIYFERQDGEIKA